MSETTSAPTPASTPTPNSSPTLPGFIDSDSPTRSALNHLQEHDPILGTVIVRVGPLAIETGRPEDHFVALARIIVGQQLSTVVARTIWNRVAAFFGEPTPQLILDASDEELRALGLSRQKSSYLRSLAEHVQKGRLRLSAVESLSDDEIINEITAVKGLGRWSADMWMMFHLHRPDILPTGDLGIQEAMRRLYTLEARPKPDEMETLAKPWRPYRTLACRYLWRYLDEK